MFGGFDSAYDRINDTWLWNGSQWSMATPAHSPETRAHHCGAFEPSLGQMVIFGGILHRNDLWSWDGVDWSAFAGDAAMPGDDGEMVYDSTRGVLVLVIRDENLPGLQTWEYGPGGWSRIMTAANPGLLGDTGLAYDSGRNRVVLFGGLDDTWQPVDDTWEYDGANWMQVNTPHSPPALGGMAMAYDAARQRTCIFGGYDGGDGYSDATWCYDGGDWTQLITAHAPSPRWVTFMSYDSDREVSVLFGGEWCSPGHDCIVYGDTWELDGSDWSNALVLFADGFESGNTESWANSSE
jgi:hypothetical protein